jgi:hypothetical protein
MPQLGRRVPVRPSGGPHPASVFRNKTAAGGTGTLVLDASSPPVATSTTSPLTTASFTPPAGALLLIAWSADSSGPSGHTITDSLGSHLTYTQVQWQSVADTPFVDGQVVLWTAVATGAAMTISVTTAAGVGFKSAALKVVVWTSAGGTPTVGASGKAGSASAASIAAAYTATGDGGCGYLVVSDDAGLGAQTAGTGCTLTDGGSATVGPISYGFARRTTFDDVNGVGNTLNMTLPGTSFALNWAWIEILPVPGGGGGSTDSVRGPVVAGALPRAPGPVGAVLTRPFTDQPQQDPLPIIDASAAGLVPRLPGAAVVRTTRTDPTQPDPIPVLGASAAGLVARLPGTAIALAARTDPTGAPPDPLPYAPVGSELAGVRPPAAGTTTITTPTPRADEPPGSRLSASTPAVAPRTGASLISATRADVAAATDQPMPVVAVTRTLPPSAAGTAMIERTTADPPPDTPAPTVLTSRAVTAPQSAGTAALGRATADPAAITDFPPVPLIDTPTRTGVPVSPGAVVLTRSTADPDFPPVPELFTVRAGQPAATGSASVVLLRPVADPGAAPDFPPAPQVVMGRPVALAAGRAPVTTLTASRADVATDTRTPAPVTVAALSAGRAAGAVLLTRPAVDTQQPTRPIVLTVEPAHDRIRIGSAVLLYAPGGPVAAGPGYLSGADTSESPLSGVAVAEYTIGGADRYTTVLVGQSNPGWTLDSTGDRSEGGLS